MNSVSPENDLLLRVGDTDSAGDKVKLVYDRVESKYIIYLVESGLLKCGDFGIKLQNDKRINQLVMKIGDLCAANVALASRYNSHRAFAFRYWCQDEIAAAIEAFEETLEIMQRSLGRRARLLYLSGSIVVILVAAAITITAVYIGSAGFKTWALVSLFGGIGAFVSVAVRGQPPALDVLEDYGPTLLYGIVRAIVAVIFAVLMYLLVLGGVFLPEIARESFARLLVLAFVAGFSEKLVPEAVIHHAIGGTGH